MSEGEQKGEIFQNYQGAALPRNGMEWNGMGFTGARRAEPPFRPGVYFSTCWRRTFSFISIFLPSPFNRVLFLLPERSRNFASTSSSREFLPLEHRQRETRRCVVLEEIDTILNRYGARTYYIYRGVVKRRTEEK